MRDKLGRFVKGHPVCGDLKTGHKPSGGEFKKGHPFYKGGEKGWFKKGHIPWDKGKKRPEFSGENNPIWKNGRNKHSAGYIRILSPNHPFKDIRGYVFEHRLVVEAQIGRYLLPEEEIHHLGAKDDNRPKNLMAFVSHSAHIRFERTGIVKPEEIIFDGRKI